MTTKKDEFIEYFAREGYYLADSILDSGACAHFLETVRKTREFGPSLFLNEEEFNDGPKSHYNTNPNPGRNIIETFNDAMGFVEKNPALNDMLSTLLGENFRWFYRKAICRVPRNAIPDWVLRGIKNGPTTTLGAYIRPEYRDIAYYHDNELHQDIMDYARMPQEIKEHRLITLYVYLSDVTADDAPTCVVPRSHTLGANPFPYNIRRKDDSDDWIYTDARGNSIHTKIKEMPTSAGSALLWHSCLLHGARPITDGHWRIGLRYMLACAKGAEEVMLDKINTQIHGPLFLAEDYTSHTKVKSDGFLVLPQSDFARTYFSWI